MMCRIPARPAIMQTRTGVEAHQRVRPMQTWRRPDPTRPGRAGLPALACRPASRPAGSDRIRRSITDLSFGFALATCLPTLLMGTACLSYTSNPAGVNLDFHDAWDVTCISRR